jgi:hypothetical protein
VAVAQVRVGAVAGKQFGAREPATEERGEGEREGGERKTEKGKEKEEMEKNKKKKGKERERKERSLGGFHGGDRGRSHTRAGRAWARTGVAGGEDGARMWPCSLAIVGVRASR